MNKNYLKIIITSLITSFVTFTRITTSQCAAADKPKRPNIVFILIDDLRYDAFSFTNHQFSKTPNIDYLATNGVVFMNSFVTISLCSPSRACFLTGQYAHIHRVFRNNGAEISSNTVTFPMLLQSEGYNTAYIGKWHMANKNHPRPGFNYWLGFAGQGHYDKNKFNENSTEFDKEGYVTDVLTEYAVNWLSQQKPDGNPFCLYLSHKAVHSGFTPPERYKNLYSDIIPTEPVSWKDDLKTKPVWQREWLFKRFIFNNLLPEGEVPSELKPVPWDVNDDSPTLTFTNFCGLKNVTKAKSREMLLDYYRALSGVDDSVGKVIETIKKINSLENTIIIFTGDNGFFWGEHRLNDKRWGYDEALRIPFIVYYPRLIKQGTKIDDIILNIDVAPALLDFAGVKIPLSMQGKSFKPLLEGKKVSSWRTSFLYEYFIENQFPSSTPSILGVRTKDWKYLTCPDLNDIDELYDLKTDPYEMNNLAQDTKYKTKLDEMKTELSNLIKETKYEKSKVEQIKIKKEKEGGE